jgi:translocation and assembly module TamA
MKFRFHLFVFFLVLFSAPCSAESLQLNIRGVDSSLQKTIETALILPAALTSGENLNKRWLKRYQRQLPALINTILEPYGYFASQVSSQVEQNKPGEYKLNVDINPGKPVLVTNLKLDLTGPGAEHAELRQILSSFPLHVGDVLRQDYYTSGKEALRQGAVALGYLDADFSRHQIVVNRAQRQGDIILQLDSGVRSRFGKTVFNGHSNYPDRFLRRYISYHEGDFFSHRQLGQTQLKLLNADLFRTINIHPLLDQTEGTLVPVQIDLQPAPRHRLRPGIGYGTDTGARVSLSYRNLNLLQRGHELQGKIIVAQKNQSVLSTYIIPDLDRFDSQTLLHVGFDREDTDSYLTRELFTEAEYQRAFSHGLTGSLFVRLTQESSVISDETERSQMLLSGLRLGWSQVDDKFTPRRGIQGHLELQGSNDTLLSDTSLVQLSGQVTILQPLPQDLSLLLRLNGGTTWHNDSFNDVPASLRFFAGGDRSVRGYSYQSLGPTDDDGEVIGGKHLLIANVELERRLTPNWGVTLFYDVGNAFDSFSEYKLARSAGIGVSRYTRIGPLRVDLARQIGNANNRYRLHVSVGFGW